MSASRIIQFLKLATVASLNAGIIGTAVHQTRNSKSPIPPSEKINDTTDDALSVHEQSPQSIRNRY